MQISPDNIISIINSNNQVTGRNARQSEGPRRTSASDETALGSQATARFRATDRSVRDVLDGITLFQIADEAQGKTETTLGRMKKVASQGTDESLSAEERENLQFELNDLNDLIGFIGRNTRFENTPVFGESPATAAMWNDVSTKLESAVPHGDNGSIGTVAGLGSRQLGLDGLDVRSADGARDAAAKLEAAAEKLSANRSLAGAQISRLGGAARNLATGAANIFSSQTRVADTENARSTLDFARRSILAAPSSALSAQAMQTQDDILSLTD